MASEGFRRKLTSILSADVQDYSRLMGADEVGTLQRLNESRAIIDRESTLTAAGWSTPPATAS